nr:uncharacterized protein LOC112032598 [Quercus suber]
MEEVHQGLCGPHMNGRMIAKKILRIGYYWNTMETNCVDYVKSYRDCQTHANMYHVPPNKLYSMTFQWPFSILGIDVNGRIAPKASNGHGYILVAIDYFTKWAEAASYSVLKAKHVGKVQRVTEEYGMEHHKSSPYQPQANRAVEAANKNVKNILAKMVVTYKDWVEKLPFTLWGYRTSIRSSTGAISYSLVYGSEVVLPIEVEIQSLMVLVETKVLEEDWAKARYEQLASIDEKRARAQFHAQGYQERIARALNKKVNPRNFKEGDLVLKVLRDENFDLRGKMKPRWSGPFIIKKIMSEGATRITDLDGEEMLHCINMDRLQKYHI